MRCLLVSRPRVVLRLRLGPLLLLLFCGSVLAAAAPQVGRARLLGGAEIDATDCAYGPGQVLSGGQNGEYLADREAFYAMVFLPANASGGHFRFRALFPRARWFSYQAYDEMLATQGVIDDVDIKAQPGSANPFLPGDRYQAGRVSYAVDVQNVAPSRRRYPSPPSVLYAGYRLNRSIGGLSHATDEDVLYTVELGAGRRHRGDVPLPRLYWVVDNPRTNRFHSQAQVCAALTAARRPFAPMFHFKTAVRKYVLPALMRINLPKLLDPTPTPRVDVFRPSSNGYSWGLFNEQTPYIMTALSASFGQFLVVRFKAPTFPRIARSVSSTRNVQTRFWDWCVGQLASETTTGCLPDLDAHIDAHGYVTVVVSPASTRPTIHGKPYADWLQWPAGVPLVFMSEIDPNPGTFRESPYFMPPTATDLVPFDGDLLPGYQYGSKIKKWMGPYYPQISYCSRPRFESHQCAVMPTP